MIQLKKPHFALLLGASLLLSACGTTGSTGKNSQNSRINAALNHAAQEAAANGYDEKALQLLGNTYKRNANSANAAINYAQALRKADYLNRASIVIAPFANDSKAPAAAKLEYAAIQLALGNYSRAQDYAKQAVKQDKSPQAYHYLGIALDAKEMPEKAEKAFRKALENWEGDPTPPMNNLALNLATQGKFDEAITTLEKAASLSPGRIEVLRNLRIVQTLQEGAPKKAKPINAPKPHKKPKKT